MHTYYFHRAFDIMLWFDFPLAKLKSLESHPINTICKKLVHEKLYHVNKVHKLAQELKILCS